MDLIAKCGDEYIDIEINTSAGMSMRLRNLNYFFSFITQRTTKGNKYDTRLKFVQINLTYGMDKHYKEDKYEYLEEYNIMTNDGKNYFKNFKIIEVNMDKVKKTWYAKDKKFIDKYKYLIMLDIEDEEELEDFCRGDKYMEKYKEKVEKLNSDEEFVYNFTREQELEMIKNSEIEIARDEGIERGINSGIEQNKIDVAKNMLLRDVDDKFIIEVTGITKEQLRELKQ